MNATLRYNFEDDVLVALPLKRKYDSSFQIGDFIFDLNKDNSITGIELLNASKVFGISKTVLKHVVSGKIVLHFSEGVIQIRIQLCSRVKDVDRVSTLSVERVHPEFVNPKGLCLAIA